MAELTIDRAMEIQAMHRLGQIWDVLVEQHSDPMIDAVIYAAGSNFLRGIAFANLLCRSMTTRSIDSGLFVGAKKLIHGIGEAGRCRIPLLIVVEWRAGLYYWKHSKRSDITLKYGVAASHKVYGAKEETVALVPTSYFRRVTASRNPLRGKVVDRNRETVRA